MKKNKEDMYLYESKAYSKGYKLIAGIDEVGRGCIAGPLVCAIVILDKNFKNDEINDSKKLTFKKRCELAELIKKEALCYHIVSIEPKEVDKLNPKKASISGMEKCVNEIKLKPDFILIDFEKINTDIDNESIIKGDAKSISIAAASIVAKDYRDQLMIKLSKKYPEYGFDENKGYLTSKHKEAIIKFGPLKDIHRFSYKPIKK